MSSVEKTSPFQKLLESPDTGRLNARNVSSNLAGSAAAGEASAQASSNRATADATTGGRDYYSSQDPMTNASEARANKRLGELLQAENNANKPTPFDKTVPREANDLFAERAREVAAAEATATTAGFDLFAERALEVAAAETASSSGSQGDASGGEDLIDKLADNIQEHYTKVLDEFEQAISIPLLNPEDLLAKSDDALKAAKDIVNDAALKQGNRLWDIAISNNKASCILRMSREWVSGDQSRITSLAEGFKEIRFFQSSGVESRVRGIKLL